MCRLDCVVELLFFSSHRIIIVILGPWHRKLNRYTLVAYFCRNNRNKLQPYSVQSINPYVSSSAFISTSITTQATAGFLTLLCDTKFIEYTTTKKWISIYFLRLRQVSKKHQVSKSKPALQTKNTANLKKPFVVSKHLVVSFVMAKYPPLN